MGPSIKPTTTSGLPRVRSIKGVSFTRSKGFMRGTRDFGETLSSFPTATFCRHKLCGFSNEEVYVKHRREDVRRPYKNVLSLTATDRLAPIDRGPDARQSWSWPQLVHSG